jgi:hypothetical protein
METDPYAAPAAPVADVNLETNAPPLWNPDAAASWSLLFSPAFGAYLHMKNWEALGDLERARVNRYWVIATIALIAGLAMFGMLFPESKALDGSTRLTGIALLVSWYLTSAKQQAAVVKERFGKTYPRRGFGLPILIAIACMIGLILVLTVLAIMVGV